ncbi:putative membrane protein [Okibacterium sp. HSC-33S16]|uniref:SHOCT domain-containing protein n=1 Tax=Okibacterium sp. HSC-33S16 TaxID=2910965 RepID=UPI00209EA857|nr:PLDc N-terminal domain-containing protein [Okibacterium sp. HSC-33S16]MCP2032425.1 putative membrane protein [Okibacterium sp. HSC-33S16]
MEFVRSIWDLLWVFFWAFAFVAYLVALFSIIGDIFRDQHLNGFLKAVWLLFLVFLPFLTALVYLIARGKGMAERSAERAHSSKAAADAYIREAAGKATPSDEIVTAKALLDSGAITQTEYETLKAKALARA